MINLGEGKETALRLKDYYSQSRDSEFRTIKGQRWSENLKFDFSQINSRHDKKQGLKLVLGFRKVLMIEIKEPVHFVKN